ncbi:MAG TPA: hypothetical protein VGF14_02880 [Alphaproteobacteria bacterium]
MAHTERHCIFYPQNRLKLYQGSDGDLSLKTYQMTASDYKEHSYNATMRTMQGGGRYVDYMTDKGWEYKKSIFGLTIGLFRDTLHEVETPSLFKGLETNTLTPSTPIEMIQFPSDDGGLHLGFRFLKHGAQLGISTYNTRDDVDQHVAVWLGSDRMDPLMGYIWDAAEKTFNYNEKYNGVKGFDRKTVAYGELVAV